MKRPRAARSVFIVDDDDDARRSLGLLLQMKGYVVEFASNGREALKKLREGPLPRLLITDLMMPVMDGWQLRTEMLKDSVLASIPVITISGRDCDARSFRAVACLTKPVDLTQLYGLLELHCCL
jgi:CheY-like chemotaxis protein